MGTVSPRNHLGFTGVDTLDLELYLLTPIVREWPGEALYGSEVNTTVSLGEVSMQEANQDIKCSVW